MRQFQESELTWYSKKKEFDGAYTILVWRAALVVEGHRVYEDELEAWENVVLGQCVNVPSMFFGGRKISPRPKQWFYAPVETLHAQKEIIEDMRLRLSSQEIA